MLHLPVGVDDGVNHDQLPQVPANQICGQHRLLLDGREGQDEPLLASDWTLGCVRLCCCSPEHSVFGRPGGGRVGRSPSHVEVDGIDLLIGKHLELGQPAAAVLG